MCRKISEGSKRRFLGGCSIVLKTCWRRSERPVLTVIWSRLQLRSGWRRRARAVLVKGETKGRGKTKYRGVGKPQAAQRRGKKATECVLVSRRRHHPINQVTSCMDLSGRPGHNSPSFFPLSGCKLQVSLLSGHQPSARHRRSFPGDRNLTLLSHECPPIRSGDLPPAKTICP